MKFLYNPKAAMECRQHLKIIRDPALRIPAGGVLTAHTAPAGKGGDQGDETFHNP
jgi:hypothetical protein